MPICPHCGHEIAITMQMLEHRLLAWFHDNPDQDEITGTATEIGELVMPDLPRLKNVGVTIGVLLSKARCLPGKGWIDLAFVAKKRRFQLMEERTNTQRIYTIRRRTDR